MTDALDASRAALIAAADVTDPHPENKARAAFDAALTAHEEAVRTDKRKRSPVGLLSIDCDDCGQVVTIPLTGDVGCGCAGTRWSLREARRDA